MQESKYKFKIKKKLQSDDSVLDLQSNEDYIHKKFSSKTSNIDSKKESKEWRNIESIGEESRSVTNLGKFHSKDITQRSEL